jgi:hypothetical protein
MGMFPLEGRYEPNLGRGGRVDNGQSPRKSNQRIWLTAQ